MSDPELRRRETNTVPGEDLMYFSGTDRIKVSQIDTVLDKDWLKRTFMVSDSMIRGDGTNIDSVLTPTGERISEDIDVINRYYSSADWKYTDTRLGGSIGINARPQFTRYSDIRRTGRLFGRNKVRVESMVGNHGMGRYYSEAIDDPGQVVYFRFGVPQYAGLLDYLLRAYDTDALYTASTGRTKSVWRYIGEGIGAVFGLGKFKFAFAKFWMGKVALGALSRPTSKYYTVKPTMHLYWSAVNYLTNAIAINLGFMPNILAPNESIKIGYPRALDQNMVKALNSMFPNTISDEGYIDVYALANRAQMLRNFTFFRTYEAIDTDDTDLPSFAGLITGTTTNGLETRTNNYYVSEDSALAALFKNRTFPSWLDYNAGKMLETVIDTILPARWFEPDEEKLRSMSEKDGVSPDVSEIDPNYDKTEKKFKPAEDSVRYEYADYLQSEFRSGGAFAAFRVDYTGATSESFSNSTGESEMASKLNSTVSTVREVKFSLSDFNLQSTLSNIAGMILNPIKDLAEGAIEGVSLGLYGAVKSFLTGGGYLDIPKHWTGSTADLPRSSYKMTLISPYNNPYSLLQNIYIPLAMLLAGGLPRTVGRSSYTSPFICEMYDRGRNQINVGMIESISITRGTSNLGYSIDGKPLAFDVQFTVVNLDTVMSIPINSGSLVDSALSTIGNVLRGNTPVGYQPITDEDSSLYNYLAAITGQDIYSQLYPMPRTKMNIARNLINYKALSSPAAWASWTNYMTDETPLVPTKLFKFLIDGTNPPALIDRDIGS